MARKKTNDTILLAAGLAIVGYLAFRQGGFLNKGVAQSLIGPGVLPSTVAANPQSPDNISVDIPTREGIGIYVPKVDPTGMQLDFMY